MAKAKQTNKIIGIIVLIIGLGLCFRGYEISGSYKSQFKRAFSGAQSNEIVALYIFGATGVALGIYLLAKK